MDTYKYVGGILDSRHRTVFKADFIFSLQNEANILINEEVWVS